MPPQLRMSKGRFAKLKVNTEQVVKLPKSKDKRPKVVEMPEERYHRDQAEVLEIWLNHNGLPCITAEQFKDQIARGVYSPITPVREYEFAQPQRAWRFDLCWPVFSLACEVDGGQWLEYGGHHNRDSDRDKMNRAAILGWRVMHFSTDQLRASTLQCVDLIKEALRRSYVSMGGDSDRI